MSSTALMAPCGTATRLTFVVANDAVVSEEGWAQFRSWLRAGSYSRAYVATTLNWLRQVLPAPSLRLDLNAQIEQARFVLEQRADLPPRTKQHGAARLEKLREFWLFQQGKTSPRPDPWILPRRVTELPEWLRQPLSSYLRIRQRNWPEHARPAQTHNLVCQLGQVLRFFLTQHQWNEWSQLSVRWVDEYVDQGLQRGLCAGTLNGAQRVLQMFCRFLREEGYAVPPPMTQLKLLNTPHRLPRPLSDEQVRRLEQHIQSAIPAAPNEPHRQQAVMDLAGFYLMWHCGLRLGEVQRLDIKDVDLPARKLVVRDSKERKDRLVYLSDTAVNALRQHLTTRPDRQAAYVFTYHHRLISMRTIRRRLVRYGQSIQIGVTPHRLRHTLASQMLNVGMPIASLQRYLGHENLDTTMGYAEVSDPLLQQDYYRGIAQIDAASAPLGTLALTPSHQAELRRLMTELKTPELPPERQQQILDQMHRLLDETS
jgi:site-specific recombinase XerD